MIPLLRRLAYAFLYDELAATRWLRGSLLAFAGGGLAFADQLAPLGIPGQVITALKIAAVVAAFAAGAKTAGERNPRAPGDP